MVRKLILIATAGMLVYAVFGHPPYDYYTLLRWIVCGVSAYQAYVYTVFKKIGWAWAFIVIGTLFNPIFKVGLSRATWAPIDIAVAAICIVSAFISVKQDEGKGNAR